MSNTPNTFEEYLREQHAADYRGLDDDMPDAFDKWMEDMEQEDIIKFADLYANKFKTN